MKKKFQHQVDLKIFKICFTTFIWKSSWYGVYTSRHKKYCISVHIYHMRGKIFPGCVHNEHKFHFAMCDLHIVPLCTYFYCCAWFAHNMYIEILDIHNGIYLYIEIHDITIYITVDNFFCTQNAKPKVLFHTCTTEKTLRAPSMQPNQQPNQPPTQQPNQQSNQQPNQQQYEAFFRP